MNRVPGGIAVGAAAAFLLGSTSVHGVASAAETQIRYEYDAHGRLIGVSQSGGNSNTDIRYAYDKAHNRVSYTVAGGNAALVVISLKGYKVIQLRK